jgi:hypothetical protein
MIIRKLFYYKQESTISSAIYCLVALFVIILTISLTLSIKYAEQLLLQAKKAFFITI